MIINDYYNIKKIELDLYNDSECIALGKEIADECVIFIDGGCSQERLFNIHSLWGDCTLPLSHTLMADKKLVGKHWNKTLVNTHYMTEDIPDSCKKGLLHVTYNLNSKGKPKGIFSNGQLDWHANDQYRYNTQTVVSLMSISGSKNSQTSFLKTDQVYNLFSEKEKQELDELIIVWKWDGGQGVKDLIESQKFLVRLASCPIDNLECPLIQSTVTGKKGIHFPSFSFSHFKSKDGKVLSKKESEDIRQWIWDKINKPEFIYIHDWEDNQIMLFDQIITLHARPTDITAGNTRLMCRGCSYLNNIFSNADPIQYISYNGNNISIDEFCNLIDLTVKNEYIKSLNNET